MDKVHAHIQAGTGGMGNVKFGGIGGKGGDVYMVATKGKCAYLGNVIQRIKTHLFLSSVLHILYLQK